MENLLGTIFTGSLTLGQFLAMIATSLLLGAIISVAYKIKNNTSNSFLTALFLIPAIESVVIMIVNDNLGVGLSVAGSFALIRFRSVKGTAKELAAVFIAMTTGIICGTGYLVIAGIFTLILSCVLLLLTLTKFGNPPTNVRSLKITIPETLDYDGVFDKVLKKYTKSYSLEAVKTLTLGSLFRIEYLVEIKDIKKLKDFIDELRTLNGNLEIVCNKPTYDREEL